MTRLCSRLRRLALSGAVGLATLLSLILLPLDHAHAQGEGESARMHLFTVVSARDEIVIGLSEAEVPALAGRVPVAVVADLLASGGRLTAWRYAPSRGEDGVIRQAPVHRVVIFAAGTTRLEPYDSDQEILPPAP